MAGFNPMDPVHAAAKDFRAAVKAIYDSRFGMQPDQFDRQARRLKKRAMERMRNELSRGHITTDKFTISRTSFYAKKEHPIPSLVKCVRTSL